MLKPKDLPYLLALHSVEGIGSARLKKIVDHFGDPEKAWKANPSELKNLGLDKLTLEKLAAKKKSLDPLEHAEKIKSSRIGVLTIWDSDYPSLLKEIYDPPTVLYYKGNLSCLNKKAVGVVGTRKITGYGRSVTEEMTTGLSEAGLVIVSGLARGVDSVAHVTALKNDGQTVAVLGGGLNLIYPPENQGLSKRIIESGGVLLSEFPPDYPHLPGNFPSRNRIISGLSLAILVTEAAQDSGSLITARSAAEQGREVFAVPGPINSGLSEGPSILIRNGATLVTSYKDVLEQLGLEFSVKKPDTKSIQISDFEQEIIISLNLESCHLDEICRRLKQPSSKVSAALIKMEIEGLVKNLGSGVYVSQVRK